MKAHVFDKDILGSISPSGLRSYLLSQGWTQGMLAEGVGAYYSRPQAGEILVPNSSKLPDYASVVSEVVRLLSIAEDRDELQIVRDLSLSDTDVIRIRIPEAEADGSVSFDKGVEVIQQSRDMLLSVACAAIEPKRTYYAGKVVRAVEYMNEVRMGQTEKGSFILTLLSPVPPTLMPTDQLQFWPQIEDEPFSRQVTRRLSLSLSAMNRALSLVNAGADISAFEEAVEDGVSANLCEATAKLIEQGDGLDVLLTWARTRQGPQPNERHIFVGKDKEVLHEVARLLKDREPRYSEKLEGFVEKLVRKVDDHEGQVTIKVNIDGRMTSVSVNFDPDQYSQITSAHDHRQPISLEGDLMREGQRWKLLRPRNLKVSSEIP